MPGPGVVTPSSSSTGEDDPLLGEPVTGPDDRSVGDILLDEIGAKQKLLALISVALGGVVAILYWPVVPAAVSLVWYGTLILVQSVRVLATRIVFARERHGSHRASFVTCASAATGVVWGMFGLLFHVHDPITYQIALPFVLAGMVAGSVVSLPAHLPSFFAFYIPALTPYAVHLLLVDTHVERALGLITVLFGLGIGLIGWQFHKTIQRSVGLGLRNGLLVAALRRSQQELEQRVVERTEALAREIEERRRSEEQVRHLVNHDALTGLPNRLLFRDRLEQGMARATRDNELMAVMMLDLDRFKQVNDRFGHLGGDALLAAVAGRMRLCVRETDTLARFGGDEFTLVQTGIATPVAARALASKLAQAMAAPFALAGERIEVTITIGIAVFPGHGDTPDDLVKHADIAMYHGKASGDAVCLYAAQDS